MPFIRRILRQGHSGRIPWEVKAQIRMMDLSPETPRNVSNHQKYGTDSPLEPPEDTNLAFELLTFQTGREEISDVLSLPVYTWLQKP